MLVTDKLSKPQKALSFCCQPLFVSLLLLYFLVVPSIDNVHGAFLVLSYVFYFFQRHESCHELFWMFALGIFFLSFSRKCGFHSSCFFIWNNVFSFVLNMFDWKLWRYYSESLLVFSINRMTTHNLVATCKSAQT